MRKTALMLALVPFISFGQAKIDFVEYDLDNGMHVILHQDKSTPIAAVTMLYHVGSKNEKSGRTGFAHFFEHLLFEGSQNIKRHSFDKFVENGGGTLNANTSFDRTFYYVLMPSHQLELGMWLESERLLHAKVEDIGIETQREVVKEEKRQRMDNRPYGSLLSNIFSNAYTVHPYKSIPIGSMTDLNAAQEEDYVSFYNTYYVPNNVTLSISGDIDIEQAKTWIEQYFGSVPSGEKLIVYRDHLKMDSETFFKKHAPSNANKDNWFADYETLDPMDFLDKHLPKLSTKQIPVDRPTIVEPVSKKEVRDTIYDNIQLPAVVQAFRIPAQGTPDFYAMSMINKLLSDGQSSRLVKRVVDKEQKALFAQSFAFPLEDPGLNISMAICSMGINPSDLEMSINEEVAKVRNEIISDREYQKLLNQVENDFYSSNSTMAGIAESLANYHTYFGDANLINTEIEKYKAVTKADIQRVAQKYLIEDNRITLYFLPKTEDK